jgi:hypothetical protein
MARVKEKAIAAKAKGCEEEDEGEWVNRASGRPIYREYTESIRCGSFHRTNRLNVSIPQSSREE